MFLAIEIAPIFQLAEIEFLTLTSRQVLRFVCVLKFLSLNQFACRAVLITTTFLGVTTDTVSTEQQNLSNPVFEK